MQGFSISDHSRQSLPSKGLVQQFHTGVDAQHMPDADGAISASTLAECMSTRCLGSSGSVNLLRLSSNCVSADFNTSAAPGRTLVYKRLTFMSLMTSGRLQGGSLGLIRQVTA
jgi:hypothetical protein